MTRLSCSPLGSQRKRNLVQSAMAVLLMTAAGLSMASATTYNIVDLGALDNGTSEARSINDAGQIVGWSTPASGGTRATLWSGGAITNLGTLGGSASYATGINNAGQIVGYSRTVSGPYHTVIWNGTTPTDLGTLGGPSSMGLGINDSGRIAGVSANSGGAERAAVWNGGSPAELPNGNAGQANSINNAGQIVGNAFGRAVLWDGGVMVNLSMPGGSNISTALDINDAGQIVGSFSLAGGGSTRAAFWDGSDFVDIGTLGGTHSVANAINESGLAVGMSYLTGNTDYHATLWDGTTLLDLNTLLDDTGAGWILYAAYDINASGQIVGYGRNTAGQQRAFLLNPNIEVSQTPVPGALPLFATGLAGFGMLSWRRRRKRI